MVEARLYFGIYFAGVSTVIMYNICMNIMRAVGDSVHPLYYLIFSSIVNMILDLIFVAGVSVECRRRCCCHGDRPGIECFIMHDPHGEGWRGCDDPF